MIQTELLEIIRNGSGVTINANNVTYLEVRQLVRAAANSGATVTLTNSYVFTSCELKTISSEGRSHVSFKDINA